MKIKDFGGEFKLIEEITKNPKNKNVVLGVGDDTAVLDFGFGRLLLWTTDMLCENDHFRRDWSSPRQIGAKAMHANISDIAAMGGRVESVLVSLSLTNETEVAWVRELYKGMDDVAYEFGFDIIGGDTTHSKQHTINVTVLGTVDPDCLCLRSNAKVGDLICVTGDVGKSMAGLKLLLHEKEGDSTDHLNPKSRIYEASEIAKFANAMIDVSDGVASEVNHIVERSGVGALVFKDKIPVSKNTENIALAFGDDPRDYALNGGEDFELLFTIKQENLEKIKVDCPITVIGEIKEKSFGSKIQDKEKIGELSGGFNHFLLE